MKISEEFVAEILKADFPNDYNKVYESNYMLQYLDKKMKAVHGNSKTRRSLANIYAVYSILYFYKSDFYNKPSEYKSFEGYDYMRLFNFYRGLYGGSKLQNHALNSRVNGESRNKFSNANTDLIIINNGKYLINIEYLYSQKHDVSKTACKIIERYIELLMTKDHALLSILEEMGGLTSYDEKSIRLKNYWMKMRRQEFLK